MWWQKLSAVLFLSFVSYLCLAQYSVALPIEVTEALSSNRMSRIVDVKYRGVAPYSVAVYAKFTSNIRVTPVQYFLVTTSRTLMTLYPTYPDIDTDLRLITTYQIGDYRARPKLDFVYALPYAGRRLVQDMARLGVKYSTAEPEPEKWCGYNFRTERGDTIRAARRGRVVEITNAQKEELTSELEKCFRIGANEIVIEHADGSLAYYMGVEQNGSLVKLGETVGVGAPVGLTQGERFRFMVFYTRENPRYKVDPDREEPFESRFVTPVFATPQGNVSLVSDGEYEAVVSIEMIRSEMTKKELKLLDKK